MIHLRLPVRGGLALVAALVLLAPLVLHAAKKPASAVPTSPGNIPIESFFRPAAVSSFRLNPAGTHLAMLAHDAEEDANSIIILDLAKKSLSGTGSTNRYNIDSFQWADDERIVFSLVKEGIYAWGLYAAHRDTPHDITILNRRDGIEVLGVPKQRPDRLLVWLRGSIMERGRNKGVLEIDLHRNQHSLGDTMNVRHSIPIPRSVTGVHRWLLDRQGEVRYAVAHTDGKSHLLRREADDNWAPITIDLDIDSPLAVDSDPNILLVAHRNPAGASDLVRFNTTDGTRGPVLHRDEKYDFSESRIHYSPDEQHIIGLTYARQAYQQVWFRPEDATLQRNIDASLPPDRLNYIISRSRDGQRMLILGSSDRHPGALYLFDQESGQLSELTNLAPWLPEKLMAPDRLVTFTARDGLNLDGYVTLPLNHVEGRPGPMIVLPHGGPWVRDVWGYDAQSQFFASRGYIVFRPNYRGSSGYNAAISHEPMFEFRRMHDDVTDGVRALIDAKIADPARIAILGASFGGYLAVCGAAYEPSLYKCAVTISGIFDWKRMQSEDIDNSNEFRFAWLRRHIGEPKAQEEKFKAMSPYYAIDQIRIPVFVAHGKEDRNADSNQSRRLARALKSAGVPHETMFISGEGHDFAQFKNRIELYTRIEAFLKKHL